jgi:hypothetical protein
MRTMGRPFVDRRGERYGRLTVLRYVGLGPKPGSYRRWLCRCDCGKEREVSYRELSRGHTQSCGCLFLETARANGGRNRKPPGLSAFNQLFYAYQRSARARGHCFDLSETDFRLLTQQPCFYCGAPPSQRAATVQGTHGDYIYTGIDRRDNAIGYTLANSRPCCTDCNFAKARRTEADFLAWVQRIADRHAA